MPTLTQADPKQPLRLSTIRPIGVYVLSGLAVTTSPVQRSSGLVQMLAVDTLRGYLVEIDPHSHNTTILNPHQVTDWIGATGLAIGQGSIWFARGESIFQCDTDTLTPKLFATLPYPTGGVAVDGARVYATCQKSGYIHIFDSGSGELIKKVPQPGIGIENITVTDEGLWVCDRTEQTVYCLDPETGAIRFSALTPFNSPTGIAFYPSAAGPAAGESPICYVSYADEEPYIRDDPNAADPHQLTFRDRTFIHPLHIHHDQQAHYTLSNGYLIELSYVEELLPLEAIPLSDVEWRIALPADTPRQKVRRVEPIGHPFTEEIQDGQRVAVFRFDTLAPHQAGLVGWKATVEMYGIKYAFTPESVETSPPISEEFQQKYLVDNDDLAMDTPTIQVAAREAVGTETNLLRKALKIRNYVYDRLSYGIQPKIDTPDVALARGTASCGEYVGILLALFRLNGIACRTIGRYKCPPKPEIRNLPLEPDFNHVWLEFYIPGIGWLPMESNVDDVIDNGPYPTRFFMGLAWYHTELGKGIPFAKLNASDRPEKFSLGNLAINHIRFTILDELDPAQSNATDASSEEP
ncbi:MAG: transglutaminase domain-containing protein [Phormidesmis sp.]